MESVSRSLGRKRSLRCLVRGTLSQPTALSQEKRLVSLLRLRAAEKLFLRSRLGDSRGG
jgi:hypothetical protein